MDNLWAPWREKYLTQDLNSKDGCVFCRMIGEKRDPQNYIIARKESCFALLNIYPYNNGHTMIVPYRHVGDISKLKRSEREEMMDLLEEIKEILQKELKPGGFNIGMNLGHAAGAGVPGHLHIHIVPRWSGDVNFMPVLSGTKVISQSLKTLYKLIHHAYKKRD
jgi:ATP adenylyltransferase